MYINNNKNTGNGENGVKGAEDLLMQKMEENVQRMAALHVAMKQKSEQLEKVQKQINDLKNLHAGS